MKTINHLDLFSGIGGFRLGFEKAGYKVNSYFSEIDKNSIAVYKYNFKKDKYVGSVTDVRGRELPKIDLITFGSPCQDFSLAGKRKGMEGERSSLIREAIRLIDECRPCAFIWENVKGTFSSNNSEDFWAIMQEFANLGDYRIEWQLLNTKWFLPQNRERIYLVGYLANGGGQQVFPIRENNQSANQLQRQQGNIAQEIEVGTLRTHNDGKGFRKIKDGNCPTIPARAREDGSGQPIIKINSTTHSKVIKYDIPEIVSVRKYEVNTKELQKLLSNHKQKTIKQISEELNLPKTQVEHWFRKDKSFSIPPKDVWFKLKEVLNIKDNTFDKSITTYIKKESVFEKTNRVYDIKGISPTLTSTGADEKILVKSATKSGFEEASIGDSINYSVPNSKTRRGRVGKGVAQTLDTACNQAVFTKNFNNKIRRLTPIECERLQGFPDNHTSIGDFDGEIKEVSDSQRYKQLGNAVSVDVVQAVAEKMKFIF